MTDRIGIIGKGHVGNALARGLHRACRDVRMAGKDPHEIRATAGWAAVVIAAVPFEALEHVAALIAPLVAGKPVVDVSNALTRDMKLALGYSTSGAERLQQWLPGAHVIKAFNTVFARHMDTGTAHGAQLTAFVAGTDAAAKRAVLELADAIGFDAVDAGPLGNARLLEPLGYLNIQLGFEEKLGQEIGFKLIHP